MRAGGRNAGLLTWGQGVLGCVGRRARENAACGSATPPLKSQAGLIQDRRP